MLLPPKPDPSLDWAIPLAAVELIAAAEGLRLRAYRCPAGVWTCGWGETERITPQTVMTRTEADERLCRSVATYAAKVAGMCTNEPSANELGAMVSLAYNIGVAAFGKSSVLKAHNRKDLQSASRAFGLWNQATVDGVRKPLAGLTARRAAESALYLQPDDGAPSLRMPQAVESAGKLSASPTLQTGAVAATVGTMSLMAEAGQHLGVASGFATQVRGLVVDTMGIPAGAILPVILLLFGGIVVWRRYGQRIKGWA